MSNLLNPHRFVSSGGLPILLEWNPENGEAVPAGWTFERTTTAWYRNDSGVWTQAAIDEARGSHNGTPGGGEKGFIPERTVTKLSLHKRDLSDAVWSATNITAVRDATGINGAVNEASTLTATAGNGTIFQSFTLGVTTHSCQAFVARKTGTGTIEMTIDGGTTWVDITSSLTSSIDNPFSVTQSLANPSIGFRIVTSGDEIEVDCYELEVGQPTTPMVVDSASTVARSQDNMDTNVAAPSTGFTSWCDATCAPAPAGDSAVWGHGAASSRQSIYAHNSGQPRSLLENILMSIPGTDWRGQRLKVSCSSLNAAATAAIFSATGDTSDTDTNSGAVVGDFSLGFRGNGFVSHWDGIIHNAIIYDEAVDQVTNEGLVEDP